MNELDGSLCTVRIRIPAGIITPEKMMGICRIAEKFGTGLHPDKQTDCRVDSCQSCFP
ncbi:hypothetical protein [uncultured Methanospirillum sp.]|uniref:hypothetical protein n=1 Tax=uncultured Methanospirillum sp. TaxID=262503 RepID=UPI0029C933A9|nr:hypothetical protein [uncultured Methanospirillum sp.]